MGSKTAEIRAAEGAAGRTIDEQIYHDAIDQILNDESSPKLTEEEKIQKDVEQFGMGFGVWVNGRLRHLSAVDVVVYTKDKIEI